MTFPPNYTQVFMERQERILKVQSSPILQIGAKAYYKGKPVEFIQDWGITYDPRNASSNPGKSNLSSSSTIVT
jgi:hypothetical protein